MHNPVCGATGRSCKKQVCETDGALALSVTCGGWAGNNLRKKKQRNTTVLLAMFLVLFVMAYVLMVATGATT